MQKILSFRGIGKETAGVVVGKQVIGWCREGGFVNRNRLALREQRTHTAHDDPDHDGSHLCVPFIPGAALLLPSHHPFVSYFFVTEWISAMYPPGNLTKTASRCSVLYGGTSTSAPAVLALVSVSTRFATSSPVISRPYGYGR